MLNETDGQTISLSETDDTSHEVQLSKSWEQSEQERLKTLEI